MQQSVTFLCHGDSIPPAPDRTLPHPAAPLGAGPSLLLFGSGRMLLFVATRWLLPAIVQETGCAPIFAWFVAGGFGVFLPLMLVALTLLHAESRRWLSAKTWQTRLWFRPMSRKDWLWSLVGLGFIGVLSAASLMLWRSAFGELQVHPPFLTFDPLTINRGRVLMAWLPFWAANILCEEILWHGVMLPRQESSFGRNAWLVSGMGWLLFHAPFGLPIFVAIWPAVFIIPYVAQRRQNTWTGVVLHAGLNGPGFLAVLMGWV